METNRQIALRALTGAFIDSIRMSCNISRLIIFSIIHNSEWSGCD